MHGINQSNLSLCRLLQNFSGKLLSVEQIHEFLADELVDEISDEKARL